MEFVQENWGKILIAASALVNAASAIAAFTRTEKDDLVINKIKDFFKMFLSMK